MSQSLVPTMGAVLIGVLVSSALYGLTTHQVYIYMQKSWYTDTWKLKIYIIYVWVLETVHTFLISAFIFRSVIVEFGNLEALRATKISDDVTTFITALIIFSVHLFYISRLWTLSIGARYRRLLVGTVSVLAVTHFALELAVMVLTFRFPEFSEFHKITAYYTGSMAVAAACDVLIAVAMWYLLSSRRTGIRSTVVLVNRIITFIVITGALTSVVDLAILICFVTMPNNLVYLGLYNMVNNLYANSLLAMINARESLGKIKPHGASTSIALSHLRSATNTAVARRAAGSSDPQLASKMSLAGNEDVLLSTTWEYESEPA